MLSLASRLVASLIFDVFFFFLWLCFFLFTLSLLRSRQLSLALCSLPALRWFWWGRATLAAAATEAATLVVHEAAPTTPAGLPACKFHPLCTPFCPVPPPPPLRCPLSHPPLSWWTECPVARGNPNAVPALIASIHFFFFFFVVAFL